MIDSPETELIVRAQTGDTEAENELVARFEPMARSIARKWGAIDHDDVCQEALIGVMKAIRRYQAKATLFTYAYSCAEGVVRNQVSANRNKSNKEGDQLDPGLASGDSSPEEIAGQSELTAEVAERVAACQDMDALDRYVFRECLLSDRSSAEAAVLYGVSKQTILNRKVRLRDEILPRLLRTLR